MDVTTLLVAMIVFLVSVYVTWSYVRTRGLPPSPAISLPLVGHLLIMDTKDPREQMQKWRQRLGDMIRYRHVVSWEF